MSAIPVAHDAADPRLSAWVSAHAGTGKTYTLANRVARLLLDGTSPQRILCLTYTKAAAAEMAGRLFKQLGEWAMFDDAALAESLAKIGAGARDADGLREARRLFAMALETPGGLKIQTIHSFCQYILARFPIEAGVPPAFDVLDEQTARELIADARGRVLERAGEGEENLADAAGYLATHAGEGKLNYILASALGGERRKFERFLERLSHDPGNIAAAITQAHGAAPGERYEDIETSFCAEMKEAEAQLGRIARWLAGGKSTDGKLARVLAKALESGSYDEFRRVFFTTGGTPRANLATKGLIAENSELYMQLQEAAIRFHDAELRCRAARAAALATAALTLAQAAHAEYTSAKRARGVLDYDDLIVETLRLLEKRDAAGWVLYKLDGGLDHILIDEAQDTSPEQWRIVRHLAAEFFAGQGARAENGRARTLFVVGDEKQSIFSFQGADPTQFEANREHFRRHAAENLVSVGLTRSRRSAQEILEFVDAVFAKDEVRDGVSSEEIKHETARENAVGRVIFWPTIKPVEEPERDPWQAPVDIEPEWSPVVQLADRVARNIRKWTDGRSCLPGHKEPIRPGDILVLMPRREPFASELIRQLKQRGVPVAGADRIHLLEQIAVMDLVALGRFVLLPEDDLNLAALLRSPLIGISEQELYLLAAGRDGTLWRTLETRRDETPAFSFAHTLLAEAWNRADYTPPFEFYAHVLGPRDGRKRMLARLGAETNDAIDEFLSLALSYERLNTPSLEGFLHWLEAGDAEIRRDMDRGRNEVRVMTVHGAKGLEADIVILPDTTTIPQGTARHAALLYDEDAVFFPMTETDAPECVRAAKAKAQEEALREHRRLLYVALTRARDELHICGFEGKQGVRASSWYDLMLPIAQARGIVIGEDEDIIRETIPAGKAEQITSASEPVRLPDWAQQPAKREQARPRLIRPSEAAGSDEPVRLSPRGAERFERGLVVHALLAHLPDLPRGERGDAARNYLSARGVDEEQGEKLIEETLAVLDHPDFAAAFAPGSRAEAAIIADLPEVGAGARVSGRLDRLAVTEDSVLAIDFKTNRPAPSDVGAVAPLYLAQMALYRAALGKVFPGRRIDCALVWTDGPALMPLPPALLDAELSRIAARLDRTGTGS
ncbi:MAG TPA: double-strand break repair helicase AddA [Rhizomicrobium sp.]|nr:double-strand break repair helicase AddA [Rhizomicrobium sp.]